MRQVLVSGRVIWTTAMVTVSSLGACAPTAEMTTPNAVSYDIDGMNVVVEEGLSFALVDETKHLLGPNTHLYMEAGAPSDAHLNAVRLNADWYKTLHPFG